MTPDPTSAYRWLIAYVTLILILIAFSKMQVGYIIEYYLAIMVFLFLVLTQYQAIASLLSPFNTSVKKGS